MSALPIEPPPGWELLEAAEPVALIAAAPAGEFPAFRPNLVLSAGPDAGSELKEQGSALRAFRLIVREPMELAGGPCLRSLGHHEVGGRAVVAEQWCLLERETGCELTASCGALDYPGLADLFSAAASSLRAP